MKRRRIKPIPPHVTSTVLVPTLLVLLGALADRYAFESWGFVIGATMTWFAIAMLNRWRNPPHFVQWVVPRIVDTPDEMADFEKSELLRQGEALLEYPPQDASIQFFAKLSNWINHLSEVSQRRLPSASGDIEQLRNQLHGRRTLSTGVANPLILSALQIIRRLPPKA